ncbi:Mannan endo-1,4-beta-mannosidase 4 [Coccomyxa sp. Obi]|nr:Mannan endo-1,4-beta-mannosidase 4 [Coccomyxa sp. Obi]
MLPVKVSPSKETRRRNGANGSDVGDIEYANPHHSNDSSPQKALLSHSHYPSDKPMDFYTQADSVRAGKAHLAGPPAELPPSLAAAVRSGKRTLVLVGGLLLGCLVLYVMWPRSGYGYGYDGVEETEHFVSVSGTQFELECRPFYVAGFNAHDLVPKSLANPAEHKTEGNKMGIDLVRDMFANATKWKLNTVRMYAHTTDPDHPFMDGPGKYNEEAWEALDRVLDEARRAGLKVMLSFLDNWKYAGGVDEIVDWSKTTPKRTQKRPADSAGDFDDKNVSNKVKEYEVARHALFFTDADAKRIYKENVKFAVTRKNTVNGRVYKDDPTIFAWGLLNEPRCETWKVKDCPVNFRAWVDEMASYVKHLDANHLVTIGEEGFFGEERPEAVHNPQGWGGQIGQDFVLDHSSASIDFATIHVWPDNWQRTEAAYQKEWMEAHMGQAETTLGKPVLLEEFGKRLIKGTDSQLFQDAIDHLRNPVFDTTYTLVTAAIQSGRPLRGVLFWRWDLQVYAGMAPADYGVQVGDSTFDLIRDNAGKIKQLAAQQPPDSACKVGCWVPDVHSGTFSTVNRCVNKPQVCQTAAKALQKSPALSLAAANNAPVEVYSSQASCCRPGLGAFDNGCSFDA